MRMSHKITILYFILIILIEIPIQALQVVEADDFRKEPKENPPLSTSYTSPVPLLPKRAIFLNKHPKVTGRITRNKNKYEHTFNGNEKYYASTLQPTKTYKYKGKYYYVGNKDV